MTMIADSGVRGSLARSVQRRHVGTFPVPDDVNDLEFPIPGVRLESNNVATGDGTGGVVTVTRISLGPGITDYVTHEKTFEYSTYGIHVGQDDRLTFFGEGQLVSVHLIDCREHSAHLGEEITIEVAVSPHRVLIIPMGVAHTLDGLGGVVTRDEPVWYADRNPDWNPDNDLVSFSRVETSAPVVQVNRHRLPVSAHLLMSRMSQATNSAVRGAYGGRYRANIAGETTYVTIRPHWRAAEVEPEPGGPVRRNNFVLTGPESFTVVPSTDSCTSDVLELCLDCHDGQFTRHLYSRRLLTWLTGSADARIEIISATGEHRVIALGDPTIAVTVPPGTWYRMTGSGRVWLRSEMELLDVDASSLEHPLGRDVETSDAAHPGPSRPAQESDRYLPGAALHAVARMEASAMSTTPHRKEVRHVHHRD
ncbi:hypothetical protein [Catellatospora tritici]|uniref:hypothetical protein n=1 Tax=Catellatospora tritici TaxID=2851566 RepID=UPI001C2CCE78|nr:hypothetical protein [Catellatospora tritici]MBV1855644.1 hypothetical protein [Catellatospora tritici]